ncbi:COPI associated protein-domain-containing protein [Halteromyces radiatus]|uniref:COPI associated protein-domain-containing protein n=1 Tax=Halteromyces radiatus TaxID=101107 RepID=UPI002220974C|nr:COPI associated protein-domain-containing protein [Halteromyces radiatus]KAI8099799.1 COPI associated protein-domain-containing protein [Halteromyces radiatus]
MISRTKAENILTLTLNCINIILYLLVIVSVIMKSLHADFSQIMVGIYGGVIAAVLVVNEVKPSDISLTYFRFVSIYSGRGMIFIFFGCISLDFGVLNIVTGTLCLVFGCIYIILSFVTNFPPPNAMIINWQNWKDFSAEGLDLARPGLESKSASCLVNHPPRIKEMAVV